MARTRLIGIVNVTPDSFSDGGNYLDPIAARAAVATLSEQGADVIDIGAESTRPGATPLNSEEEWARLSPVLSGLSSKALISIDTRHAETAKKALAHKVDWINDVSGFSLPAMIDAVKNTSCKLVVMHSLTVPADKNIIMQEKDVVAALVVWAKARFTQLENAGIARSRLVFDPGLGFGKNAEQSRTILQGITQLKTLGVPLLIGHSRKSFLSPQGVSKEERDRLTLAISKQLIHEGVDYLRVHDVNAHRALLKENA